MASHSSTIAWKIPWMEEPGRLQSMGCKELDTTEQLHFSITSWQIDGETVETVRDFIFVAPKSLQMVTAAMKLKDACSLEEKL